MNHGNRLFVYGSLRRGEVNFPVMARAGARFVGTALTLRSFPLLQGPRWRRLLDRPGIGRPVVGELFMVGTTGGWQILDDFEGHPHGYRRRLEMVLDCAQRRRWAWIYFYALR